MEDRYSNFGGGFEGHALLIGGIILGTGYFSYKKFGVKGILYVGGSLFLIQQYLRYTMKKRNESKKYK